MSASLDSALDPMEEIRFRKKHSTMWMELQKETHFTFDELESEFLFLYFLVNSKNDIIKDQIIMTAKNIT